MDPFPAAWGAVQGGACEASARLCKDVQHGCFPSNLTEKLQWMATCFCKQFGRNFAVSPDRLCIALFSNHSLIHWLSRYLLQIPALGVLWDQSRSMLHLLSFVLFKIRGVQGARHPAGSRLDSGWEPHL